MVELRLGLINNIERKFIPTKKEFLEEYLQSIQFIEEYELIQTYQGKVKYRCYNDHNNFKYTRNIKMNGVTDVVEIECQTPLLANAYYNEPDHDYLDLKKGNIAIKMISGQSSTSITLDPSLSGTLFCSISLYNPKGNPDMTFDYGIGNPDHITENSMQLRMH